MALSAVNQYPRLHNAMWPGLVGKGPDSEPPIELDAMLALTATAQLNGVRFDGVDLFLDKPHVSIDSSDDDLRRLAEKVGGLGLAIGSLVAPVWPANGGGSAIGGPADRSRFIAQVRKACRIASKLRESGVRTYGVVRIDSACSVVDWARDPAGNSKKIAETFREACRVAADHGERLAAEGEICWGGMHSWRTMLWLLEEVGQPERLGFQADMAHALLFTLGYNWPEDSILPNDFDWKDTAELDKALAALTAALRPWMTGLHIAQSDGTVKGSGSHERTGRHCLPNDPAGKLDIVRHAGFWLRDTAGTQARAVHHICWDGCFFPNATIMKQETWNDILAVMIAVRDAHGWPAVNSGQVGQR